jgi:DNA-binding GntR family transcriptional regulator
VTNVIEPREPLVQNAAEAAVKLLRDAILDGRIAPGARLKEGALARDLGISRTPVREALRALHIEGLVQSAPNRGATVRSYTVDDLREIYSLRALLEGHAARLAAPLARPQTLDRLRESCVRFAGLRRTGAPIPEFVQENLLFHEAILEAAGSSRLVTMARRVMEIPLVYRTYSWYSPDQRHDAERQHLRLVQALERHDADRAEIVMKEHIYEGADLLFEHLSAAPFDAGENAE